MNIIHIFGFRGDLLIKKSSYLNIKIITTVNSNIYDDYTMLYGKVKGSIMAKFHMTSLKGKVAIGCSNFVTDQLNAKYKSNLKTIYNGIPKESYAVASFEEKSKIRKDLGLGTDAKLFIFVGYLIYRKDPLTTIKGFLMAKEAEESALLIIGDGPLRIECMSVAKQYPERTVIFLGNQPETLKYLKCADYYISSSYSEGLPTAVMEAMGCGLPVILSNIQPHCELTRDIENCQYLFDINDEHSLAKKINEILLANYNDISAGCRTVIDQKINSQIMAQQYGALYSIE